jgi:LemA protein
MGGTLNTVVAFSLAESPGFPFLLIGGVLVLAALGFLAAARAADRKNYIIERATPLPLSLVNERDDVWLRGVGECDAPVAPPHFDLPCLYYDYTLEERVRKTRHTKKGTETHYTWETRDARSEATTFRLKQDDLSVEIDGATATYRDLPSESDTEGSWRHSLSYLPCPCEISALGSIGEKKARLEAFGNIPLMVTTRTREEFVRSAESKEKVLRFFGFALAFLGPGLAAYGLVDYAGWPVPPGSGFSAGRLVAAAIPALGVFGPLWLLYLYNSLVTYQVRVANAWRQVDVDLKMRYDLIPQLVTTAQAYMTHERELLEHLTRLRGAAMAGGAAAKVSAEGEVVGILRQLGVVVERYPDLKAQPAIAAIARELRAIEEKVAHGRGIYNEAATEYNDTVQSFPHALLASLCGFAPQPLFRVDEAAEREPPTV